MDVDEFYEFVDEIDELSKFKIHAFNPNGDGKTVLIEGDPEPEIVKKCANELITLYVVELAFFDGSFSGPSEDWYWSEEIDTVFVLSDMDFTCPADANLFSSIAHHPERAQAMFPASLKRTLGLPNHFYMVGDGPDDYRFLDRTGEYVVFWWEGHYGSTEIVWLPKERTFVRVYRSRWQGSADYSAEEIGSGELWTLSDLHDSEELERAFRVSRAYDH